ncbi:cardiolipin synthase [Bacillus sp. Marseille-P3661]|uniref:cardiolipin synthase n=1 Tax=Bacillus sp. Marseille-P3661 TaxID=1936234 RepID=UPI000C85512A|nr:cardiolipin synthase [Bacillus sp. Marseille-P3661]
MKVIFLSFALLIAWLVIDYNLGRWHHLKNVSRRHYPTRRGKWLLFNDGQELFTNIFQDIVDAKHHIHILFYIVKNDNVSREFLTLLRKKAQEGVTVRLLVDRIGSHIPKKTIKKLRESGVQFAYSNRIKLPFIFYSLNYRNHRKITIVDGTIGYLGGFNIGKEYLGQDPELGYWRDFHLKIFGDGVQDLQSEFLLDWHKATGNHDVISFEHTGYYPKLLKGQTPMQFVPTDGAFMKEFVINFIKKAQSEIMIGTPYFIPGNEVVNEILAARKRGVKVTILVPLKADHAFVKEASYPYFKNLLKAECEIYRYIRGFYHGKILLVDGTFCDIGTANFDKRSFFINKEINCLITDPIFIEKIRNEYMRDIQFNAERLTMKIYNNRPYLQRGKELLSTMVSDLL